MMDNACLRCKKCIKRQMGNICPIMNCPKGLVNGPCGGSKNGQCEVSAQKRCVWMEIFERTSGFAQKEQPTGTLKDYSKLAKQELRRD